ncbi:Thiol:disulfide interchange protein DsbD precursor [Pseudobythopirellula maris]|uniref:Thiol:disulfide interchange protein DsbD n=1 Tax=Pseudobythopirellula maris TaxID=2527991 RepID=A0A5C5ZQG9_9BACT|nr:thioredoxin family protein [Pseudobythopirellula maris]TWT88533.1 Thiol:disulfide interchange protein DsbD precursor [Pseudobythopirellula maris]
MRPHAVRHTTCLIVALLASLLAAPSAAQFQFNGGLDLNLPGLRGDSGQSKPAEPVRLSAQFYEATAERPALLQVTADIAPSYHIYSITQPAGGPEKTVLTPAESGDYELVGAFTATPAPESHVDEEIWVGLKIEEHTGRVTWTAPIRLAEGVDPSSLTIQGSATLQACQAFSCLPLELDFTASLATGEPAGFDPGVFAAVEAGEEALATAPIPDFPRATNGASEPGLAPADDPEASGVTSSLLATLGFALMGGLILNLMPCVLPVIGLKVMSFAEQAGHDPGRVLGLNLAYAAGMLAVFLLLATLASLAQLGLGAESYGWGELYTLGWFKVGMIALVFAMALSFLGVWEIPIPGFAGAGKSVDLQQKEGVSGAFFKGVFTTILATPCSGPFLGPVFAFTIAQPPVVTYLIFTFVGLGMALPYLLIGLFPSLIAWLPKPGAWMETFKQLMGFVLMGTVVFLFSSIAKESYLPVLALMVALGVACWWIGRTPITASPAAKTTSWVGGLATVLLTGWLAFGLLGPSEHELPWKPYSNASLALAQQRGKTVLVDFTAEWCLTCKLNLKTAIDTEKVKEVIAANGVEPLIADWTDRNDEIKAALSDLNSISIPLLAIYPADRPERPIVLRDSITQSQLLAALHEAGATRANDAGQTPSESDSRSVDMPQIELGGAASTADLR